MQINAPEAMNSACAENNCAYCLRGQRVRENDHRQNEHVQYRVQDRDQPGHTPYRQHNYNEHF